MIEVYLFTFVFVVVIGMLAIASTVIVNKVLHKVKK